MFLKELQNCIYMLKMLLPSFTVNTYIIKEGKDKREKLRAQNFIDEPLHSKGSIVESKRHDQKLIVSLVGAENNFKNVNLFHKYLVVAWSKIQFGEEVGTMHFIKQITNDQDGKLIFDSQFIEGTKIKTHMPITFLL